MTSNKDYLSKGVAISPAIPGTGDQVKLYYDGLLAKSGATHVYAHVGYGRQWKGAGDYQMKKTSTGFEATIPVPQTDSIHVCFKDCANNWDNNSGKNYSFDVTMQ